MPMTARVFQPFVFALHRLHFLLLVLLILLLLLDHYHLDHLQHQHPLLFFTKNNQQARFALISLQHRLKFHNNKHDFLLAYFRFYKHFFVFVQAKEMI